MLNFLKYYRASLRFDAFLEEWGGALFSVLLRVYLGLVFFKAGLTKIADWDSTLALFQDEYQVPLLTPHLAAISGTMGELLLPVLLWTGFLTRPAAVGLFLVNLMAVISYPQLFTFDCPAALNDHRYWGILLLVLVVFGPKRFSADWMIAKTKS